MIGSIIRWMHKNNFKCIICHSKISFGDYYSSCQNNHLKITYSVNYDIVERASCTRRIRFHYPKCDAEVDFNYNNYRIYKYGDFGSDNKFTTICKGKNEIDAYDFQIIPPSMMEKLLLL